MPEEENLTENNSEISANDEVFFFEEDNSEENNFEELNKKFKETSEENAKIKKEVEELKAKTSKIDELEKREAELQRQEEINIFKNNYSWLSESSIKAISDLRKNNPEKSLEEVASEYGFLQEVENAAATSRNPKGRSFVLPNTKQETKEIPKSVMRSRGWKTSEEVDSIRADFWI